MRMWLLVGLLMSLGGVVKALTVGGRPRRSEPECPLGQAVIRSCPNNNCQVGEILGWTGQCEDSNFAQYRGPTGGGVAESL
jgi:hypothetical protein